MTGDITRFPPPQRTDKLVVTVEFVKRLMPSGYLHCAAKKLTNLKDRWDCQLFTESDHKELESALRFMAHAEEMLNDRLSAAVRDVS